MKEVRSEHAPSPIGPYSQGIEHNGTLYLSGQIAIDPKTNELVQGDIARETHQVMKNIAAMLHEKALDFSSVIKCSIFLKSMDDFNAVNEVYGTYFSAPFPARECVQVAKLPKNVNVEISVIAAL